MKLAVSWPEMPQRFIIIIIIITLTGTYDTVAYTDSLAVRQILLRPFTESWVRVGLEIRHDGGAWKG